MKNKKFDFRLSSYFPQMILILGVLLGVAGLALIVSLSFTSGIICIVLGTIILTTSYRLEIDFDKRSYKDYVWFLGIKNGKEKRFEQIEYLFVKKGKLSQQLHSRASSTIIIKDVFNGYLKFSEEEKIHLCTLESKSALVSKLKRMAGALRVKIVDYSADEPVIIK